MQSDFTPLNTLNTLCLCLKILNDSVKLNESNKRMGREGWFLNLGIRLRYVDNKVKNARVMSKTITG